MDLGFQQLATSAGAIASSHRSPKMVSIIDKKNVPQLPTCRNQSVNCAQPAMMGACRKSSLGRRAVLHLRNGLMTAGTFQIIISVVRRRTS